MTTIRLLVIVPFGILSVASIIQPESEQQRAVKAIRDAGGIVQTRLPNDSTYSQLFCDSETNIDVVIKELRHFPDIEYIQIPDVATDEYLKGLGVLPRLN